MRFAALHMSVASTELPIPNVRSSVANGGKADKICSMGVLRILTRSRRGGLLQDVGSATLNGIVDQSRRGDIFHRNPYRLEHRRC